MIPVDNASQVTKTQMPEAIPYRAGSIHYNPFVTAGTMIASGVLIGAITYAASRSKSLTAFMGVAGALLSLPVDSYIQNKLQG